MAVAAGNSPEGPTRPAPITAPAGIAAPVSQTEYVALSPCRLADSRLSPAGKFTRNSTRVLQITGTTGFSTQGGAATGCGVPAKASAVVLSFTTVNSSGQGRLVVYPSGVSEPNSTALTYYKNVKISGEVTSKLGADGTIRVKNVSLTATDIATDVVGYYTTPIAVAVSTTGTILSSSPQITSVLKTDVGQYQVFTSTNVLDCVATATAQDSSYTISAYTDQFTDRVEVYVKKASDGTYVDSAFALAVTC
ncbi:MAG TPA: hypothetical protein VGL26_02835 [Jatrophihabitans sp.]